MANEKKCTQCGVIKPFSEFYRRKDSNQTHRSQCKQCTAVSCAKYQKTEKGRQVNKNATSKYRKTFYGKRKIDEYYKSELGIEALRKKRKKLKQNYPEKIKARDAVNNAIKSGALVKLPCKICGSTKKIEAHHESYKEDKWLNVRWLCSNHHLELHKKLKEKKCQSK